jgi:Ca2+-binding EF-hand superfamily protein
MPGLLTKEKQKECMGVFYHFSKGKNEIDKYQLKAVLNALGADPDNEDLNKIWDEIDVDKSGFMDSKEFLELFARKMKDPSMEEDLISAFSNFDLFNTGYISIEELKKVMCTYGNKMNQEEFNKFISIYLTFIENEQYLINKNSNNTHNKNQISYKEKVSSVDYKENDEYIDKRFVDYKKFAKFLLK